MESIQSNLKKGDCDSLAADEDNYEEESDVAAQSKALKQEYIRYIERLWSIVKQGTKKEVAAVKGLKKRRGWKTVRVFVSSMFRDMFNEREVLAKEIFPDLRLWCEKRKIRLVECDLRWGVPKGASCEETAQICLGELDRCREDNVEPYFVSFLGERVGWVPEVGLLSNDFVARYGWAWGLSVTEMEIVHGAFRSSNPKALFMLRTTEGFNEMPEEEKAGYADPTLQQKEKLKILKSSICEKFRENHIYYHVKRSVVDGVVRWEGLSGTDTAFYKTIVDFLKKNIGEQYPLDPTPQDPMEARKEAHRSFMDSKCIRVLGRNDLIEEIESYYISSDSMSPLIVAAESGAGKSSLLAKCAKNAQENVGNCLISVPDGSGKWRVFYHFVGAAPGSTNLVLLLKRLVKELDPESREKANDIDSLTLRTKNLLAGAWTSPCILFIDAINQLDEEHQQYLTRWLPETLSPNVRVVVSTIIDSASHRSLRMYQPPLNKIICGPLDVPSKKRIVVDILRAYNKKLDETQMALLMAKKGAENPLWLTLACEELRVHGTFETVTEKIEHLPEELIALEKEVIGRFENSHGGELMRATLCLLEVSRYGLLETELLFLLGGIYRDSTSSVVDGCVWDGKLPAREWAVVYRNLKPLLRPCGGMDEGRLNFYHQSFSKAVMEKYFSEKDTSDHFQRILADFFEKIDDVERKAEELPYHLELLGEQQRLRTCLLQWNIFNQLFSEDHSMDLLRYWQKCGGYEQAVLFYTDTLSVLKKSDVLPSHFCDQQARVAYFLLQAGQYSESLRLMEECVSLEVDVLNSSRVIKLGDLYGSMALCQHQVVNLRQDKVDLEENILGRQRVVDLCKKSNKYRMLSGEPEQEYKTAITNDLLCFQLTRIAQLKDSKEDAEYQKEAYEVINQAMEVFTKFNMMGEIARCIQTAQPIKPFTKENLEEQKAGYLKARDMCLKAYGENHKLYSSITINMGDFFHTNNMFSEAYDNYVACERCRLNIMGPEHPYTLDIQRILKQEPYVGIHEQRARETAGAGDKII